MLSTHDQLMIPCIQCASLTSIMSELENSDVILINEGQFFSDLKNVVLSLVETHGKCVYIYALDGDFKRNKFGEVADLIPYSDTVTKLHALCSMCKDGTHAIFSKRISSENEQVVIGSDNYKPVCRTCYNLVR
jgi:thymidine kinase